MNFFCCIKNQSFDAYPLDKDSAAIEMEVVSRQHSDKIGPNPGIWHNVNGFHEAMLCSLRPAFSYAILALR